VAPYVMLIILSAVGFVLCLLLQKSLSKTSQKKPE